MPTTAIIGAGAGALQSIFGAIGAAKGRKNYLSNLQNAPQYTESPSIANYYQTALQRYNVNPYSTSLYRNQQNQIGRNVGSGLNALTDRRSALAGVGNLVQGANDASLNAGTAAEGQQNQRFGMLGQAAGMKAQQDQMAYQYNKLMPFQMKADLYAGQAAGGNQTMNAGLSNIFGGLNSAQQYQMINKMYSQGGGNNGVYLPPPNVDYVHTGGYLTP